MKYVVPPKTYPGEYVFDINRKTIIVDLDSTLVYSFIEKPSGYNGGDCWFLDDVTEEDGTITTYYVLIRPYARQFLERCMQYYNIVFFTAAEREYAEPILEMLCPEVGPERRYYRDSCIVKSNVYTKNLRTLSNFDFDECSVFLFDDNAPDNTIPPGNGMFCSQYAPDDDSSCSEEIIQNLLEDNALEAFADLFCSERFLRASDIRIPLAEYKALFNRRLMDSGEE